MASSFFNTVNSLALLLWLFSTICGGTQESEMDCMPSIRVPRNTVWVAPENQSLKINCTVVIDSRCHGDTANNLTVLWCKIEENNECRPLNRSNNTATDWRNHTKQKSVSFLIFRSLSEQDAGLYRCRLEKPVSTVGHTINVTVTASDTPFTPVSDVAVANSSKTNDFQSVGPDTARLWPYVYISSGIAALVLLVVVLALFIIHCQRSKQPGQKKADNQSRENHVPHFPSPVHHNRPHGNTHSLPVQLNPPSCCIYDNAPVRASSQRNGPPRRPPVSQAARPGQSLERLKVDDEEESPLVYASLNHKTASRGPVRVSHPEETSEYAAIRLS